MKPLSYPTVTTAIISVLLLGWMIADSRLDLAAEVFNYCKTGGNEERRPEITPNSSSPDIATNWFTGTASVSHQMPFASSSNRNESVDEGLPFSNQSTGPGDD